MTDIDWVDPRYGFNPYNIDEWPGTATLDELREFIEEAKQDNGANCPACDQFARENTRQVTQLEVAALRLLLERFGTGQPFGLRDAMQELSRTTGMTRFETSADIPKLRYLTLVQGNDVQPTGEELLGYGLEADSWIPTGSYVITPAAEKWLAGETKIPAGFVSYDGRFQRYLENEITCYEAKPHRDFDIHDIVATERPDADGEIL